MSLTIYEELEQGSDEWHAARCGIMTASELNLILSPTLKLADNEKTRKHVYELAAQRITNYVEPTYIGDKMLRGWADEEKAKQKYAQNFAPVKDIGGMVRDFGKFKLWVSPDGLVGDDGGVECKSRDQKFQIEAITTNEIPIEHRLQVQAQMLVSGRQWWDYLSYSGGLPMWPIRALPDEAYFNAITAACEKFEAKVQEVVDKYHARLAEQLVIIETERDNGEMEVYV